MKWRTEPPGTFWISYLLTLLILLAIIFLAFCSGAQACGNKAINLDISHYSSIPEGKPFNTRHSPETNLWVLSYQTPLSPYAILHLGFGVDASSDIGWRTPIGLARLVIPLAAW